MNPSGSVSDEASLNDVGQQRRSPQSSENQPHEASMSTVEYDEVEESVQASEAGLGESTFSMYDYVTASDDSEAEKKEAAIPEETEEEMVDDEVPYVASDESDEKKSSPSNASDDSHKKQVSFKNSTAADNNNNHEEEEEEVIEDYRPSNRSLYSSGTIEEIIEDDEPSIVEYETEGETVHEEEDDIQDEEAHAGAESEDQRPDSAFASALSVDTSMNSSNAAASSPSDVQRSPQTSHDDDDSHNEHLDSDDEYHGDEKSVEDGPTLTYHSHRSSVPLNEPVTDDEAFDFDSSSVTSDPSPKPESANGPHQPSPKSQKSLAGSANAKNDDETEQGKSVTFDEEQNQEHKQAFLDDASSPSEAQRGEDASYAYDQYDQDDRSPPYPDYDEDSSPREQQFEQDQEEEIVFERAEPDGTLFDDDIMDSDGEGETDDLDTSQGHRRYDDDDGGGGDDDYGDYGVGMEYENRDAPEAMQEVHSAADSKTSRQKRREERRARRRERAMGDPNDEGEGGDAMINPRYANDVEEGHPGMGFGDAPEDKQTTDSSSFNDDDTDDDDEKERKKWLLPILCCALCILATIIVVIIVLLTSDNDPTVRTSDVVGTPQPSPILILPTREPSASPIASATNAPTGLTPTSQPGTGQPVGPPMFFPTPTPPGVPGNDECQNAIGPLQPNFDGVSGSISGSNADPSAPAPCSDVATNGPGVWYYAIGNGGEMMAHTCAQVDFDSRISIYSGSCTSPRCIEGNDNACGEGGSAVSWISEPGIIYTIFVHGDLAEGQSGNFELTLLSRLNDECATSLGPFSVNTDDVFMGSTDQAQPDSDVSCGVSGLSVAQSRGVWHLVRGTGGRITASTCSDVSFQSRITVLTGDDCGSLECLPANFNSCTITWMTTPFQDYYVVVHGTDQAEFGSFGLSLTSSPSPNNDLCPNALGPVPLDGRSLITGSTETASVDTGAGACGVSVLGPGVWYYVVGDGSEITASLCDESGTSSFDTRISVYEGDCSATSLANLSCIDGNENACGSQASLTWASETGKVYRMLVHGRFQETGEFNMRVISQLNEIPQGLDDFFN